jgi:hypothetical protein
LHPDPEDLYVFGPPGSASEIYLYGSGSFHQQAKKRRKILISTVLRLLYDFLFLNSAVNVVPSKRNAPKNLEKKIFGGILRVEGH